jgi:hypothetical protein
LDAIAIATVPAIALGRTSGRISQPKRWPRAYRTLLGREPDPSSRSWVNQVKSNNWTEQQLTDEIKKSPEYIAKHPRERR